MFYNTYRFELKDKGSFWLSETPEEMSKDWGAACYRICSYVILTDKESGKDLVVFNTHLDHISDEARINGINVVLEKIKQFGGLPSIIMGDFNAEEDSDTYRAATENFYDAKYQTEVTARGATYQNWGKQLDRENIDYFMISKEGIAVNEYRIIDDLKLGLQHYMASRGIKKLEELVGEELENFVTPSDLDRSTIVYPMIDRDKCIGCGRCHVSCMDGGHQAISFDDERKPHIEGGKCVGCHLCSLVCPMGAITHAKRINKKPKS